LETAQNQGTVRVLALRDPTTLMNFDVVIISYQFMVANYQKRTEYLTSIANINKTGLGTHPDRKNIALYSNIYVAGQDYVPVHYIRRVDSIQKLAQQNFCCSYGPVGTVWHLRHANRKPN
jgi:hypothetical protein